MRAAERHFFAINNFVVAAFVDFAAAVSANVHAGFDGYGDKGCEAFEQACAKFPALYGELKNFAFFLTHGFLGMGYIAFFFELLQKRVNERGTDFFFDSFFELAEYAVAVGWSLVEYGEYVEA
jgi:hypothetical protein